MPPGASQLRLAAALSASCSGGTRGRLLALIIIMSGHYRAAGLFIQHNGTRVFTTIANDKPGITR